MAVKNQATTRGQRLEVAVRSIPGKIAAIAVLVLLLLIPKAMVMDLISERQNRQTSAKSEISNKWGAGQTLWGPFIRVPFEEVTVETQDKKVTRRTSLYSAVFLPKSNEVNVLAEPEIRYRGIFEVVLYKASIASKAEFDMPDFSKLESQPDRILWNKASLVYGISDIRGIQKDATLSQNGADIRLDPGSTDTWLAAAGIHSVLDLSKSQKLQFEFRTTLNGTEAIWVAPVGQSNSVQIQSKWRSPSFQGAFLPKNRNVDESGFKAIWEVPHIARNFPQQWEKSKYGQKNILDSAFGVDLIQPVNSYTTTTRSAKYGVMFIVLTFLIFFLFEILSGIRVHPVQYLLIGFALLLFYVLLLALSEQIQFGLAYLAATSATVGMVTAYSASVVSSKSNVWTVGLILAFVYGYLYCLLKIEDYALLLGSAGLFIALAIVMYATRKVNWYAVDPPVEE